MADVTIREMRPSEYGALENFLYEVIYIPDDASPPPRKILEQLELKIYVENFGARAAEICFVAEVNGKILSRLAEKNFKRISLSV